MAFSTSPPRVLVTGASGFVGSHIVQQLLRRGNYIVCGSVRDVNNERKIKPLHELYPEAKYPLELVQADLLDKNSWESAVQGCDFVIHVASPFPSDVPKDEDEVIKPAVDGTRNVLEACANAGCVKRVVVTSSSVAIYVGNQDDGRMLSEKDWSVIEKCSPYEKSKVLAEKFAWDFVKDLPDDKKFELVVINPGFVLGPVLHGSPGTSMELHRRLLQREMSMLPKIHLPLCDVRDVAEAHVKALTLPGVAGNRFYISSGSMWMKEFAQILEREFKPQGYCVPTCYSPKLGLQIASLFSGTVKGLLPSYGKVTNVSHDKMVQELGMTPIEMEKTIIDMAYNLIDKGFIKTSKKYHKRTPEEQTSKQEGEEVTMG